ncbi:MAG: ribonuclease H-like domain-containing protein [Bacteroidales bacterium]|nr:ribonuclease H-like domain-containing protein [Bacteroidales bacterium]
MYAIIDIETTGLRPQSDKITEVAIYIHDGNRIVNEFATLIHPEKTIPYFISGLTGITNEMVEDAPRFYEVAKKIIELTDNQIFVAHNARFDYNFIKEEFKRLGYHFKRDIFDTVKLSRRLIPGLRSYSLGKLCNHLDIQVNNRHRAAGDALATVKLFELLLNLNTETGSKLFAGTGLKDLHPGLSTEKIKALPEETGVYYFYDENDRLIYVGKSKNIHQRVLSHLSNNSSQRKIEMRDRIAQIDYELTGSELIAYLLESDEIKKNKPVYNRAQRRETTYTGIYASTDINQYLQFTIGKINEDLPLASFSSVEKAKDTLNFLTDEYHLCQKLTGLYKTDGPCFQHQIGICFGACIGKETPESYNKRAQKALKTFEYDHQNFFIIDKGRSIDEKSVVKVEHGKYLGYGYFIVEEADSNPEILHDCIQHYADNRDVQSIIKRHIRNGKIEKLLVY